MASPATVPMFDPNGNIGDVPQEQMQNAMKAGGKLAIPMIGPDGSHGYVPHDQVVAAQKAGGKVDTSTPEHSALKDTLNAFGSDLAGVVKAIPGAMQGMFKPGEIARKVAAPLVEHDQERAAEGRGGLYRAGAAVSEAAGANVAGMEQAAKEGKPGAVVGHAAAGIAPLAASQVAHVPAVENAVKSGAAAVSNVAGKAVDAVKEAAPGYLKSADELAGTTPARINELKTVPDRMAAVHKLVVDTESKAKATAKAAYPKIETPITRTSVDATGKVVQEQIPFEKVQEERANVGQEIANEKRNVARGAPAYDLKSLVAKYDQLSNEMRTAAQTDGKLAQFQTAEAGWKRFMDDFHNSNSPVRQLLDITPDQTSKIANHILNADKGARTLEVLRRNGADTSGVEKILSKGSTPLKVDVTESAKLRKAGSDSNYRTQRLNEALDQATTNRLPSGTEAKLPAAAMKSHAPGIVKEIPGSDIISPRNVTRVKLNHALRKTLSGTP